MICTKCGARLMENDQFCPKCGAKVIKEKRCPDCGAALRDGIKFCPECGRPVGGKRKAPAVSDDTLDIPFEAIERNILSETAAEIKGRRTASSEREPVRRSSAGSASEKRASSGSGTARRAPAKKTSNRETENEREYSGSTSGRKKQSSVPAPPPRKKKPVYREEDWEEEEEWDEEDNWDDDEEDDDWDDDDWNDEGIDVITIMTVVIGCVLLIVVAFLGYRLYRQYVPKNYGKAAEEQEQGEEEEQGEAQNQDSQDEEAGNGEEQSAGPVETNSQDAYTLTIDSRVNVRSEPSTSSAILKVAQTGETYGCHGTAGDGTWYEIVLEDGTTGYVFQDYVSVE